MSITKKILSLILTVVMLITTCSVAFPVLASENSQLTDFPDELFVPTEEDSEVYIVSEDVEKREENAKHFRMSDGSYVVAQYNTPVHYLDENGKWIDIDNTVTSAVATAEQTELFGTDEIYSTSNITDNVVFAEKSNSNTLVSYEAKNYPISFNYQSAKNSQINIIEKTETYGGDEAFLTLTDITQEVIYENVFVDVDLQYIVSPTGLKENIILKSESAQNSFTVNYNIGELTAEVVDSNTINLMAEDEVVYTISAPYMTDANGEKSEAVTLTVEKNKNGKLRLVIGADESWLSAEGRAYPVVVDPIITATNFNELVATNISSVNGSHQYENLSEIHIEKTESGDEFQALIKLDSIESCIYSDRIVSAKLHLPLVSAVAADTEVYLYETTSSWNVNNVSWSTKPDLSDSVVDFYTLKNTDTALTFDITELYYKIVEDDLDCDGVLLKLDEPGVVDFKVQNSNSPVLILKYLSTVGLDEDYSYSQFDMGTVGTAYINNFTGNLIITRDVSNTVGDSDPYYLTETYNSFSTIEAIEQSWFRNYKYGFRSETQFVNENGTGENLSIAEIAEEPGFYSVSYNSAGFIKTRPNKDSTTNELLSIDAWTDDGDTRYNFDPEKGLMGIFLKESGDVPERVLFSREVMYNEDETEVLYLIDGNGDKLEITGTADAYTVKQLDTDKNLIGDTVVYTKDANGNVTQITLNGNVQAIFTYDELNRMTSVTNDVGYKLTLGYQGESKAVSSVSESKDGENGQQVTFEREYNRTNIHSAGADGVFGNTDDVVTTYRFNKKAKATQVQNKTLEGKDLGAVAYSYKENADDDLSGMSDLASVSAVGKNVVNLLQNHNLESMDNWTLTRVADSASSYTLSSSTEKYFSGTASLKMQVTDFSRSGLATAAQTFRPDTNSLEVGKTYTASAYVNTEGLTRDADAQNLISSHGAFVIVRIVTDEGTDFVYSDGITATTQDVNGGWERTFATFTVPADYNKIDIMLALRNATGTAYFDSVQLEVSDIPNQYNILENNGFNYSNESSFPEKWQGYNATSTEIVENGQMKIVGDPDTRKGVYQDVQLTNATQSDSYTYSAWAEADAVPYTSGKYFIIYPFVRYEDAEGNKSWKHKAFYHFDYYDDERQYVTGSFNLKHPTDSTLKPIEIRLLLCYYNQCNTALFDNIALYPSSTVYDFTVGDPVITEDEKGREISSVYPDGTTYEYTYHGETDVVATEKITEVVTADDGTVTTETIIYAYNTSEQLISLTEPDGTVYNYTYDNNGNLLSKLTADGVGDEYTYHGETDVVATEKITEVVTADDGTVTTETIIYAYNTSEQLISLTEPDGTVYNYTYDNNGNLVSKLTADGVGDRFTYNDNGDILTETYEDGSSYTYTYHSTGELATETIIDEGVTTVYTYDTIGNLLSVSKNNTVLESYTYISFDTNNDGVADKSAVLTENLEDGTQNSYDYYSYNKLKTHTVTKNEKSITYHYDVEGKLTKVDHNGFEYNYEYDAFGNTTAVKVGSQNLVSYAYQPDKSKKSSEVYGNGSQINYTYNSYGQVKTKTSVGLGTATTRYDALGNLIYEKDNPVNRKTYYEYDSLGNLYGEKVSTTTIGNSGYNFLYSSYNSLDENGNITKNTVSSANKSVVTSYTYNDDNMLSNLQITGNRGKTYTYNDDGSLAGTSMSTVTPVTEAFSYNDEGYIESHNVNGTVYSYSYDDNGNITEIKKDGVVQQSYAYDEQNQLERENNVDTNKTIVYTYDGYGNIESKAEYAYTLSDEPDTAVDVISYSYDSDWKDKLASYDGQSITYDAIGNPTNYMGATMTWFARQMMSYSKNGTNITYKYDNDGLRAEKTVNGVKHEYYYVDGLLRIEKIGDDYEMYYRYDTNGVLASVTRYTVSTDSSSILYAQTNTRGDVISLYDGNGATRVKYVYDSWGKLISATDRNGNALAETAIGSLNSIRYRGYVYDSETGLYYLQSRYYDPEVGRFLNADSVDYIGYSDSVLSYNMFAYCENDAVNYADYTGLERMNVILKVMSKVVVNSLAFIALTQRLKNYDSFFANQVLEYRYIRQVTDVDVFKGVYMYSYVFRDSPKISADKYYINFYFGTKESWQAYCDYHINKNYTFFNISKYITLLVISACFAEIGLALGILDFTISESGMMELEKQFALSSQAVMNVSENNYFIAIRGITKLYGYSEKQQVVYEGDEHVWPVVIK